MTLTQRVKEIVTAAILLGMLFGGGIPGFFLTWAVIVGFRDFRTVSLAGFCDTIFLVGLTATIWIVVRDALDEAGDVSR